MSKIEINQKLDEIVDFSGVEKFIDTPVKRYSSGMYVRLAFAVAAHLEPEILLVDEVLTVGDASFQKKCLGKMESMGKSGRTVLFVSHNMPAVTRLCPRTILLDKGELQNDGPTHQVVSAYLQSDLGTTACREWPDLKKAPGNAIVRLRAVRIKDANGKLSECLDIRKSLTVEMEYQVLEPGYRLIPNFHFYNEEGTLVFIAAEINSEWHSRTRPAGRFVSRAWIPGNFLAEGILVVEAALSTLDPVTVLFDERDAVAFHVVDSLEGTSARGDYAGHMPGIVRPMFNWETDYRPPDKNLFPSGNGGQNP